MKKGLKMRHKSIKSIGGEKKGITLIALVVTITVLLIVAGITMNVILDENGIKNKMQQEAEKNQNIIDEELKDIDDLAKEVYGQLGNPPEDAVAKMNSKYYTTLQSAIDEVPTNNTRATIFLLKDVEENVNIESQKNIVLYLGNYTLTNKEKDKETIILEGKLKILNGKITGEFESGVATINVESEADITFIETVVDRNSADDYLWETVGVLGKLEINSGSIQNAKSNAICTYPGSNTEIRIGGTANISSNGSLAIVNYGTLEIEENANISSNDSIAIVNRNEGEVNIIGGTITSENNNAIYNLGTLEIGGNASISTISKNTINNSGTLKIGENATISTNNAITVGNNSTGKLTITGGTITSENGHAIKSVGILKIGGTANIEGKASMNYPTVVVEAGEAGIKGGTITANGAHGISNSAGGRTTITGGTITSENNNAIYNYGTLKIGGTANISSSASSSPTVFNKNTGKVTITGGTITSENSNAINNYGTLEIGGTANISTSSIKVTIANGDKEQPIGNLTITGGTITSEKSNAIYNYGTLEIEGKANISTSSTMTIANGSKDQPIGNLTITGGTITSENSNAINNYGTLEIGGTANINGKASSSTPTVVVQAGATASINGGTITAKGSYGIWNKPSENTMVSGENITKPAGNITITGGNITSENSYAINNYGTLEIGGTTNISSNASSYATVYNNATGNLTITGGTINNTAGGNGVYNSGGTVTHTGGTISPKKSGF